MAVSPECRGGRAGALALVRAVAPVESLYWHASSTQQGDACSVPTHSKTVLLADRCCPPSERSRRGFWICCGQKGPEKTPLNGFLYCSQTKNDPSGAGRSWRETDEERTDRETVITDLMDGQYSNPVRVVASKTAEGSSRDSRKISPTR